MNDLQEILSADASMSHQQFQSEVSEHSDYRPISSVWERGDGELLETMLRFYPSIPPEPILDSTYNAGRFWKGSKRRVVSMDIDPKFKTMIVGDNRNHGRNSRFRVRNCSL